MVVAAGNFSTASSRLFVTQSTVSARIALLEEKLGCTLFVRNKAGTALTPEGHRFQRYATTLVQTVERARQDIGVSRRFRDSVTISGRIGLWEELMLACLPRIRELAPHMAIRAEIGFEDDLMQGLVEARTDIAVMYAPQQRPGLVVERLFEELLVYVTSVDDRVGPASEGYVYVDWGPEFASKHSAVFPDFEGAALAANIGWLGLHYIVAQGGSGYFPLRLVRRELERGRLQRQTDLPEFKLPAYMVYAAEHDSDSTGLALVSIRETVQDILSSSME